MRRSCLFKEPDKAIRRNQILERREVVLPNGLAEGESLIVSPGTTSKPSRPIVLLLLSPKCHCFDCNGQLEHSDVVASYGFDALPSRSGENRIPKNTGFSYHTDCFSLIRSLSKCPKCGYIARIGYLLEPFEVHLPKGTHLEGRSYPWGKQLGPAIGSGRLGTMKDVDGRRHHDWTSVYRKTLQSRENKKERFDLVGVESIWRACSAYAIATSKKVGALVTLPTQPEISIYRFFSQPEFAEYYEHSKSIDICDFLVTGEDDSDKFGLKRKDYCFPRSIFVHKVGYKTPNFAIVWDLNEFLFKKVEAAAPVLKMNCGLPNGGLCLRVKLMHPEAMLPTRASDEAAGYDIRAWDPISIPPDDRRSVATGVAVALPKGTYGRIAPRSGLALKKSIDVAGGVIDSDYRGEILVILVNHSAETFEVQRGDRIAQLIIGFIRTPEVQAVDDLDHTPRGDRGFGSTGESDFLKWHANRADNEEDDEVSITPIACPSVSYKASRCDKLKEMFPHTDDGIEWTLGASRRPEECPLCLGNYKRNAISCTFCNTCPKCCSCEASFRCDRKGRWYHTPYLITRHHVSPRGKPYIPRDLSLLTGERITTIVLEDGTTKTVFDSLNNPAVREFPPPWTGATSFRAKISRKMVSTKVESNLKVPMVCCESSSNPYRGATSYNAEMMEGLAMHHRANVPGKHVLIEVCCGDDSRFGRDSLRPTQVEVIRITLEVGSSWRSTATGLTIALPKIREATTQAGRAHVTIWFALPCTWGSVARVSNSTQGQPGEYTERSGQLWGEIGSMLPNLIVLMHGAIIRNNDIVFEWPKNNYGYGLDLIQQLFTKYGLISTDISGCKLGLVNSKGIPAVLQRRHG